MTTDNTTQQIEIDIKKLEFRITELIDACESLTTENKTLRVKQERLSNEIDGLQSRQQGLVRERASLLEKTELARNRVEVMITRLKALETAHEQ